MTIVVFVASQQIFSSVPTPGAYQHHLQKVVSPMQLDTLRQTLVSFATNPSLSWGDFYGEGDFLAGTQARVPVEQADRNTARLCSGTYTAEQLADFDRQCERVEVHGGTAYFAGPLPETLEFTLVCQKCQKSFASCKAETEFCYQCKLDMLCPALPGRHIGHHWFYNDHEWTLEVHGDVGWHNELTFWWSNRYTGSNVGHQGLIVKRDGSGNIKKLVFSTAARHAVKCYHIEWNIESRTTTCFMTKTTSVIGGYSDGNQVDELDPLALDLIFAMIPAFMLQTHRPRNPANGCYTG